MTVIEKQSAGQLIAQELALKVYIDALLEDVTETSVRPTPELTVVEQPTRLAVATADEVASQTIPSDNKPAHPEWAETQFDCVLFKVAGALTLAVPLIELSGIVKWNSQVTPLPGHQDWFLGLLSVRGRQVKVIDMARFVIPEQHRAREIVNQSRSFKHIILVGNGEWGLACEDMGKVLKLSPDAVRWRADRSQRPWLAGMLVEHMCALLDVERFIGMAGQGTTQPVKETRRQDDNMI